MIFSPLKPQTGHGAGKEDPVAGQWLLWIDGVGGYLLLPGDDWIIGGPTGAGDAEICIQGDLSRREACLRRQGSDYVLQPLSTVLLGGRRMNRPALLRDGDRISLGNGVSGGPSAAGTSRSSAANGRGVRLEFAKPHPLSASARLAIHSRHRTRPHSDGVVLLADTCVVGPARSSHIVAPQSDGELVLLYRDGRWICRGGRNMMVDGRATEGRAEVHPGTRVEACGLSFTLEAVVA